MKKEPPSQRPSDLPRSFRTESKVNTVLKHLHLRSPQPSPPITPHKTQQRQQQQQRTTASPVSPSLQRSESTSNSLALPNNPHSSEEKSRSQSAGEHSAAATAASPTANHTNLNPRINTRADSKEPEAGADLTEHQRRLYRPEVRSCGHPQPIYLKVPVGQGNLNQAPPPSILSPGVSPSDASAFNYAPSSTTAQPVVSELKVIPPPALRQEETTPASVVEAALSVSPQALATPHQTETTTATKMNRMQHTFPYAVESERVSNATESLAEVPLRTPTLPPTTPPSSCESAEMKREPEYEDVSYQQGITLAEQREAQPPLSAIANTLTQQAVEGGGSNSRKTAVLPPAPQLPSATVIRRFQHLRTSSSSSPEEEEGPLNTPPSETERTIDVDPAPTEHDNTAAFSSDRNDSYSNTCRSVPAKLSSRLKSHSSASVVPTLTSHLLAVASSEEDAEDDDDNVHTAPFHTAPEHVDRMADMHVVNDDSTKDVDHENANSLRTSSVDLTIEEHKSTGPEVAEGGVEAVSIPNSSELSTPPKTAELSPVEAAEAHSDMQVSRRTHNYAPQAEGVSGREEGHHQQQQVQRSEAELMLPDFVELNLMDVEELSDRNLIDAEDDFDDAAIEDDEEANVNNDAHEGFSNGEGRRSEHHEVTERGAQREESTFAAAFGGHDATTDAFRNIVVPLFCGANDTSHTSYSSLNVFSPSPTANRIAAYQNLVDVLTLATPTGLGVVSPQIASPLHRVFPKTNTKRFHPHDNANNMSSVAIGSLYPFQPSLIDENTLGVGRSWSTSNVGAFGSGERAASRPVSNYTINHSTDVSSLEGCTGLADCKVRGVPSIVPTDERPSEDTMHHSADFAVMSGADLLRRATPPNVPITASDTLALTEKTTTATGCTEHSGDGTALGEDVSRVLPAKNEHEKGKQQRLQRRAEHYEKQEESLTVTVQDADHVEARQIAAGTYDVLVSQRQYATEANRSNGNASAANAPPTCTVEEVEEVDSSFHDSCGARGNREADEGIADYIQGIGATTQPAQLPLNTPLAPTLPPVVVEEIVNVGKFSNQKPEEAQPQSQQHNSNNTSRMTAAIDELGNNNDENNEERSKDQCTPHADTLLQYAVRNGNEGKQQVEVPSETLRNVQEMNFTPGTVTQEHPLKVSSDPLTEAHPPAAPAVNRAHMAPTTTPMTLSKETNRGVSTEGVSPRGLPNAQRIARRPAAPDDEGRRTYKNVKDTDTDAQQEQQQQQQQGQHDLPTLLSGQNNVTATTSKPPQFETRHYYSNRPDERCRGSAASSASSSSTFSNPHVVTRSQSRIRAHEESLEGNQDSHNDNSSNTNSGAHVNNDEGETHEDGWAQDEDAELAVEVPASDLSDDLDYEQPHESLSRDQQQVQGEDANKDPHNVEPHSKTSSSSNITALLEEPTNLLAIPLTAVGGSWQKRTPVVYSQELQRLQPEEQCQKQQSILLTVTKDQQLASDEEAVEANTAAVPDDKQHGTFGDEKRVTTALWPEKNEFWMSTGEQDAVREGVPTSRNVKTARTVESWAWSGRPTLPAVNSPFCNLFGTAQSKALMTSEQQQLQQQQRGGVVNPRHPLTPRDVLEDVKELSEVENGEEAKGYLHNSTKYAYPVHLSHTQTCESVAGAAADAYVQQQRSKVAAVNLSTVVNLERDGRRRTMDEMLDERQTIFREEAAAFTVLSLMSRLHNMNSSTDNASNNRGWEMQRNALGVQPASAMLHDTITTTTTTTASASTKRRVVPNTGADEQHDEQTTENKKYIPARQQLLLPPSPVAPTSRQEVQELLRTRGIPGGPSLGIVSAAIFTDELLHREVIEDDEVRSRTMLRRLRQCEADAFCPASLFVQETLAWQRITERERVHRQQVRALDATVNEEVAYLLDINRELALCRVMEEEERNEVVVRAEQAGRQRLYELHYNGLAARLRQTALLQSTRHLALTNALDDLVFDEKQTREEIRIGAIREWTVLLESSTGTAIRDQQQQQRHRQHKRHYEQHKKTQRTHCYSHDDDEQHQLREHQQRQAARATQTKVEEKARDKKEDDVEVVSGVGTNTSNSDDEAHLGEKKNPKAAVDNATNKLAVGEEVENIHSLDAASSASSSSSSYTQFASSPTSTAASSSSSVSISIDSSDSVTDHHHNHHNSINHDDGENADKLLRASDLDAAPQFFQWDPTSNSGSRPSNRDQQQQFHSTSSPSPHLTNMTTLTTTTTTNTTATSSVLVGSKKQPTVTVAAVAEAEVRKSGTGVSAATIATTESRRSPTLVLPTPQQIEAQGEIGPGEASALLHALRCAERAVQEKRMVKSSLENARGIDEVKKSNHRHQHERCHHKAPRKRDEDPGEEEAEQGAENTVTKTDRKAGSSGGTVRENGGRVAVEGTKTPVKKKERARPSPSRTSCRSPLFITRHTVPCSLRHSPAQGYHALLQKYAVSVSSTREGQQQRQHRHQRRNNSDHAQPFVKTLTAGARVLMSPSSPSQSLTTRSASTSPRRYVDRDVYTYDAAQTCVHSSAAAARVRSASRARVPWEQTVHVRTCPDGNDKGGGDDNLESTVDEDVDSNDDSSSDHRRPQQRHQYDGQRTQKWMNSHVSGDQTLWNQKMDHGETDYEDDLRQRQEDPQAVAAAATEGLASVESTVIRTPAREVFPPRYTNSDSIMQRQSANSPLFSSSPKRAVVSTRGAACPLVSEYTSPLQHQQQQPKHSPSIIEVVTDTCVPPNINDVSVSPLSSSGHSPASVRPPFAYAVATAAWAAQVEDKQLGRLRSLLLTEQANKNNTNGCNAKVHEEGDDYVVLDESLVPGERRSTNEVLCRSDAEKSGNQVGCSRRRLQEPSGPLLITRLPFEEGPGVWPSVLSERDRFNAPGRRASPTEGRSGRTNKVPADNVGSKNGITLSPYTTCSGDTRVLATTMPPPQRLPHSSQTTATTMEEAFERAARCGDVVRLPTTVADLLRGPMHMRLPLPHDATYPSIMPHGTSCEGCNCADDDVQMLGGATTGNRADQNCSTSVSGERAKRVPRRFVTPPAPPQRNPTGSNRANNSSRGAGYNYVDVFYKQPPRAGPQVSSSASLSPLRGRAGRTIKSAEIAQQQFIAERCAAVQEREVQHDLRTLLRPTTSPLAKNMHINRADERAVASVAVRETSTITTSASPRNGQSRRLKRHETGPLQWESTLSASDENEDFNDIDEAECFFDDADIVLCSAVANRVKRERVTAQRRRETQEQQQQQVQRVKLSYQKNAPSCALEQQQQLQRTTTSPHPSAASFAELRTQPKALANVKQDVCELVPRPFSVGIPPNYRILRAPSPSYLQSRTPSKPRQQHRTSPSFASPIGSYNSFMEPQPLYSLFSSADATSKAAAGERNDTKTRLASCWYSAPTPFPPAAVAPASASAVFSSSTHARSPYETQSLYFNTGGLPAHPLRQ